MVTNTRSSAFSFSFYGSEATVFGAIRGNHGQYQGYLDGTASPIQDGSGSAKDQFPLFTARSTLGKHNVTIINLEDKYFDVDFVSALWPWD